mmetsp:Transcript_14472/g.31404  ORF Transcript_14472/g.31404 Transcript_14472/m.31404 type:complete len:214 (+) Transcript_14472:650-1291(+)
MLVRRLIGNIVVEELVTLAIQVHSPALRHRRSQCPFSDVQQIWVGVRIHAQVTGILCDFFLAGGLVHFMGQLHSWSYCGERGAHAASHDALRLQHGRHLDGLRQLLLEQPHGARDLLVHGALAGGFSLELLLQQPLPLLLQPGLLCCQLLCSQSLCSQLDLNLFEPPPLSLLLRGGGCAGCRRFAAGTLGGAQLLPLCLQLLQLCQARRQLLV